MTETSTAIFGYDTANLGDDMQSIAALAHLRRVDRVWSRDVIHKPSTGSGVSACVFNSWFKLGDLQKAPHESLDPLMYGVCIGRKAMLDGQWREYFRQNAPIGCRDRHTQKLLAAHGIDAHFTACLTLQLGKKLEIPSPGERSGVLVVDVEPDYLKTRLDPALWQEAEFLTMDIGTVRRRPFSRLKLISDLLRKLATAKLVVTRRLHVGSPAISLGTPVILLPESRFGRAEERFSGFEELINFRFQDELPDGFSVPAGSLINRGVAAHEEVETGYRRLLAALKERGVLEEKPLSLDYPERQLFRFDAAGWPEDAVAFAACGWAEQPLAIRSRQGDIIEASLPGFIGYDRFRLEFFVETPDGQEIAITPVEERKIDGG